ncbi:hypothetical protein ABMA28_010242 [Loxostege sticticalis]|uniref:Uncharacterized protein n=1 Tax=Loxostege sticticalis TaxID=481309 RepID=A0ABD0SA64_LOXSC
MTPIILDGNNLGQRHQHYNRLLKQYLANNQGKTPERISYDDNDINNFLKIDIASHNRDVSYILEVLKCKDLLYVTRAIKKSKWLITDNIYCHIINPKYLHKELFPHMMQKAKSKLLLHIRLYLRDENRVAQFYNYCKQFDVKLASKWLQYCPLEFALNEVHVHAEKMTLSTLKRLCRRSFDFLKQVARFRKGTDWKIEDLLKEVRFLIRKNTEEYLKITYSDYSYCNTPFRKKHLAFIMKTCPQIILNTFVSYFDKVDYTVLVKYMNKDSIKHFLLKSSEDEHSVFISCHKVFVKFLPQIELHERIQVLKAFYYDRASEIDWQGPGGLNNFFSALEGGKSVNFPVVFRWYQCMPFRIAFREMTVMIENEVNPDFRILMINTLLICAGSNLENLFTLLKYYNEIQHNESYKSKANFVSHILSRVAINKLDTEMWTLLDNLFCSMEVYQNSSFNVSKCVEAIIIYKISHDQTVPEIIQSKFKYKTLKSYKSQLSSEESEKLFNFLYKMQIKSIENIKISTKDEMRNVVTSLEHTMVLLVDWNKNITCFTLLLNKIRECIQINRQNNWETDLSSLYNIHKPWRRYFFEESLMLNPTKLVLLNILKHDHNMLSLYKKEVDFIRYDDTKSLQPVLSKIKIYWSDTLAKEWINDFFLHIKENGKQKVAIQSLAVLLSQKDFVNYAKQYIPNESKMNDLKGTDEEDYNWQKYFASNMHKLRPLPTIDIVLWFSKGDYLRFALTSLSTTFANHSHFDRNEYFSKLTSMQGYLQKHIIHMALAKLDIEKLMPILKTIWKSTTNQTLRTYLFLTTHDLLCQQSRKSKILRLWKLLDFFIENLSMENSIIINKMKSCLQDVPEIVRSKYCMKAYFYFKTIPNKIDADGWINSHADKVFEFVERKFIEDVIMKTIVDVPSQSCPVKELFAKYLFFIANTEAEHETYERLVKPMFYETDYYSNFKHIVLNNIPNILHEYVSKNKRVPLNLCKRLLDDFRKKLGQPEDYIALKTWELMCDFIKLMEQYIWPKLANFNEFFKTPILIDFGKSCSEHLQRDSKIFPYILIAFGYALTDVLNMLKISEFYQLQLYKYMLEDKSLVESYILVQKTLQDYFGFSEAGSYELHPAQKLVLVYRDDRQHELDSA